MDSHRFLGIRQWLSMNAMDDGCPWMPWMLKIAGVERMLFDETAVTAIQQGSGGLFRKANHLARGALIAAAKAQSSIVQAEHVRLANTEIF